MPEASRPLLLFVPGELHLFRATGAYHALELSRDFDLVLVVTEHYRGDRFFDRFLALCSAKEVCYLPVRGNFLSRNRRMATLLRVLIRRWRPAAVYQHAFVYPHNLYVLAFARAVSPRVRSIVFQAGMTAPDIGVLAANLAAGEALRFAQRHRIPTALARLAYRLHYWCWSFLSYRLLPLVFAGRVLPVPYDLIACRMRAGNASAPDAYLVYDSFDRDNIAREYGALPYRIVRNPITETGATLDAVVYGAAGRARRMVILPSQDWANEEIAAAPQNRDAVIARHAQIWSAALARLCMRYPGRSILWKPHPVHRADSVMLAIVARVRDDFPDLALVQGDQPAEALMVESEIVISDVSTVLWWASLHPGLTAISLDLWGAAGGDALKGRPGIHYVSDIAQIDIVEDPPLNDSAHITKQGIDDTVKMLIACA